eukprot:gene6238-11649_t
MAVFAKKNITIGKIERFYPDTYDEMELMNKLKPVCRIIIFLCYSRDVARMSVAAKKLGMHNGEYMFIAVDLEIASSWDRQKFTRGLRPVKNVLSGIISVKVSKVDMKESKYNSFNDEVIRRMAQQPFNINVTSSVLSSAAYLYDAVLLYAHALNKSLSSGNHWNDSSAVTQATYSTAFTGITGRVRLDENGDRVPIFIVDNVQNGAFIAMKEFDPELNLTNVLRLDYVFPGGTKVPPRAIPVCGFDGKLCVPGKKSQAALNIAIIIPFVILLLGTLIFFRYKKWKYERVTLEKELIVNCNEVAYTKFGESQTSKVSYKSNVFSKLSVASDEYIGNSDLVGVYQTQRVYVKKFQCTLSHHSTFSKERLYRLKQIRDLHHTNVNLFIGAGLCNNELWILWEHCSKGSLQDILQNDDIDIDWMFKFSFAVDIVKENDVESIRAYRVCWDDSLSLPIFFYGNGGGIIESGIRNVLAMVEIHKRFGVHGNLKSSNCLVDSRWVIKVSDFGYDCFDRPAKDLDDQYQDSKEMFWTAPEFLANNQQNERTKAGDVYSYGIIMKEICSRCDPYEEASLSPSEIISKIQFKTIPPFRPVCPETCDVPAEFIDLMTQCWDDFPEKRPSFKDVFKALRALGPKKSTNLVDQMLTMMEKYTNNLEDLVKERTRLLEEEKMKTEKLLEKMLPPSVAEDLKVGKPVLAEHFTQVTIFFSDIVGFTALAAESSPMQVVQLLNDLYSEFDKIIQNFDVYKVETIGDAYMVVSGLPKRNGKKNAGEIATMALHLLHSIRSFKVRHKRDYQLQLRIGIHTGSCVAGVVGLTMPRYCLFGDTVNFASRMESSGLALRIHVSPACKSVLDDLGGYHLEKRGPVVMKGKGTVTTYFLVGKDGFDLPLPDLRRAAAPSDHEFK